MDACDRWGPFADGLDPGERIARQRSLRAIVRLYCGARALAADRALREAETRPAAAEVALVEIMALAPLDRRRVLASYAALGRAK